MRAFVAVVGAGGLSAAARRLHVSQPRLSQTVLALEREFGTDLLVRGPGGVRPTETGAALYEEARAVLARFDQAVAAVSGRAGAHTQVLRCGVPYELPPGLLAGPMAALAEAHPEVRVRLRHLSSAEQLAALRAGDLDIGLVRGRPTGQDVDASLVVEEKLGVLLAAGPGAGRGKGGVRLESLAGLRWVGFPRSDSPAWYDEVTAILHGHGIATDAEGAAGELLLPEVKIGTVAAGAAFAFAPPDWSPPLPEAVVWRPLAGSPVVRRTWAAWPASSRRRDVGNLVVALGRAARR